MLGWPVELQKMFESECTVTETVYVAGVSPLDALRQAVDEEFEDDR